MNKTKYVMQKNFACAQNLYNLYSNYLADAKRKKTKQIITIKKISIFLRDAKITTLSYNYQENSESTRDLQTAREFRLSFILIAREYCTLRESIAL